MPPVTAERSPPASRMTGADSPVMAASFTEAMPSMTSPSPGMISFGFHDHEVALAQHRRGHLFLALPVRSERRLAVVSVLRLAQRVRLRLAASLGHRFGEVREQHGDPQPERDLKLEGR